MKPIRITVDQAEGDPALPCPQTYTAWADAAHHLRAICFKKGPTLDYYKTDVTLHYPDGSWERRRFDAQMDEIPTTRNLEAFRSGTLLCQRSRARR